MSLEIRDIWHETRERCKRDLFFLGQEVLGYDYGLNSQGEVTGTLPRFLLEMRDAEEAELDYLMLGPRGHSKTTSNCVVGSVKEIVKDVNTRILLAHGVLDRAQLILKEATDHFRYNEKFRTLFPEHAPQGRDEDPTSTRFTTPARTKIHKEPTIMAAAPGSTVTGLHFKRIKCTDLVNEQNVPPPIGRGTIESMNKVTEFIKTLTPLLDSTDPRSSRQLDGTRWFMGDAYGYMIENYPHFRFIIQGIEDDKEGNPIPIWDLVSADTLRAAKTEAGKWLWHANYVNAPLAGDTQMFKRDWFSEYTEVPSDL